MEEVVGTQDPVIKTYCNDDEKLRQIGTILATPKSRLIYSKLIEKEFHAKELAKTIENVPNPRLPIIKFHLDKMVDAGLVTVQTKFHRKNGKHLKYYRAAPFVLIAPPATLAKIQNNKTIQKLFKDTMMLGSIALTGCALLFSTSFFWKHNSNRQAQKTLNNKILNGHLLDDIIFSNLPL